jgi:hypothetical protein
MFLIIFRSFQNIWRAGPQSGNSSGQLAVTLDSASRLLFLALERQQHEFKRYDRDDDHRRLLCKLCRAFIRLQEIAIVPN